MVGVGLPTPTIVLRAGLGPHGLGTCTSYVITSMATLGRWFRRTRRAVAAVQLLAFAGALVFQGIAHSVETVAPNSTVQTPGQNQARPHDLLTCPSCTLLRTPAHVADVPRVSLWEITGRAATGLALDTAPQRLAEQSLFSRAPPALRA